jgi:hypothetical protein
VASTELVPFKRQHLELICEEDGKAYTSPKRICDNLGVSWPTQRRKLAGDHRSSMVIMNMADASGNTREICVIPIGRVAWWLTTIDPRKCRPEVRAKLQVYQIECADVLDQHIRLKQKPQAASPPPNGEPSDSMELLLRQSQALSAAIEHSIATRRDVALIKTDVEELKEFRAKVEERTNHANHMTSTLSGAKVEAPAKTPCDETEQRVRWYCQGSGLDYRVAWNRLYEEFYRRCGISVKRRKNNHPGKYHTLLDVVRDCTPHQQAQFYAIACELFPSEPEDHR